MNTMKKLLFAFAIFGILFAQEQVPANFLEGATEADPFAGMTATVTVTVGTNS